MRRILWFIAVFTTLVVLAVGVGGYWIFYTEQGLAWIVAQLPRFTGTALTLDDVTGTLARGIAIARLRYDGSDASLTADGIALRVSPSSLLLGAPYVSSLRCRELIVTTVETRPEPRKAPESLALPVRLYIGDAHFDRIVVNRNGSPLEITDVGFRYGGGMRTHRLQDVRARIQGIELRAEGELGAHRPFPIAASIDASSSGNFPATVSAELRNTLLELAIAAQGVSGAARAELSGIVLPFKEQPLQEASASLSGVDLHALDKTLPQTDVSGTLSLRHDGDAFVGPLRLTNARAGPWNEQHVPVASLSADVRTDLVSAQFTRLVADLGAAGQLAGSADVSEREALLRLTTRRFNLKGVHTALQETHFAGHADLALQSERQSANAQLTQDNARLTFRADRVRDLVQVPEFRLQARGGELSGRGRISLAGTQPYAVTAELKGFDPSAWGDFPAGSLKGKIAADGSVQKKTVAALYALDESRLLDLPFSSRGDVRYEGNRVLARYLELHLGGNDLAASGAFGAPRDTLRVRIDASRLSAFDARWAGRVNGTALVSGTWQAPQAAFDLSAKELTYAESTRVGLLTARGDYRHQPDAAFNVTAVASGIVTPAWRTARATIEARGTESAHTLTLQVRDNDLDLALHARGGWQKATGWAGTLLDLTNRGTVPFALESEVSVQLAQERTRIGPFSARIMGGALQVGGIQYEAGRVITDGRYSEFPVRPILLLAGVPTQSRDTLRISGAWSLTYSPRLNGYFTLQRDSGDLTIGADRTLQLGLETLRCDAKIVNDRVGMQGTVRSSLVNGTINADLSPLDTAAQRITLDSPMRFTAALEVVRLAAFSALTDANMHFDGRARATVSGTGTLRKPVVSGMITADQLVVAFPPQGVELRDGMLRAQLANNEVRVQEFVIHGGQGLFTAQGTLAAGAQRASLDWRADRLTLLGRPDRHLIVSGSGNAGLNGGKVSLSGALRADSGSFRFGGGGLPTLGEDVVVVGRPRPQPQPPGTLSQATLNLDLDLGNNMHIVGQGLDAWINGKVHLKSDANGKILAQGNVATERGSYTAFGQRLQIDRGRILFNGPIENPGLDVVAMRKNQAVEAGVAVTGTINSPYVRITSQPPVPESEALAWLVLGHGPADASRGDLAMLPLAAASLFGDAKTPKGSFAERLGVDTIALRGSSLNSQVVAVGKRISHNLYVIYEQALGATTNVLKLELNVTQRVLMRAEAGQTSSLGLFFRYAFD